MTKHWNALAGRLRRVRSITTTDTAWPAEVSSARPARVLRWIGEPKLEPLFKLGSHAWHTYARTHVAKLSPQWAAIEARRHVDAHTGEPLGGSVRFLDDELRIADWELQRRIEDTLYPRPSFYWLWWFIEARFTHPRRRLEWRWQRMRRGWADTDVWGLHSYLATVIADSVEHLRKSTHGWPGEPMTPQEWDDILAKIVAGFRAAVAISDVYEPDTYAGLKAEIDTGFDLFKEHFLNLWD